MFSQCDGVSDPGFRRRRGRVSLDSAGSEQDSSLSPDSTGSATNLEKDVSIFLQKIGQKPGSSDDGGSIDFRKRSSARKSYANSLRSSITGRSGRSSSTDEECMYCDTFQNERQYFMWRSQYVRSSYCNRCSEEDVPYISYWGKPSYEHGSWRKRYKAGRNVEIDLSPLYEVLHRIDMIDTSMGKPNNNHRRYNHQKDIIHKGGNLMRIADTNTNSHSPSLDNDKSKLSDCDLLTSAEIRHNEHKAEENVCIGTNPQTRSTGKTSIDSDSKAATEDNAGQCKTEPKAGNATRNILDEEIIEFREKTDHIQITSTRSLDMTVQNRCEESFSDSSSSETISSSQSDDADGSNFSYRKRSFNNLCQTNNVQSDGASENGHDLPNRLEKSELDKNHANRPAYSSKSNIHEGSHAKTSKVTAGATQTKIYHEEKSKSVKDIITNMEALTSRQATSTPLKRQTNSITRIAINSPGKVSDVDKTKTSKKIIDANFSNSKSTSKVAVVRDAKEDPKAYTETDSATLKRTYDTELCKGSESENANCTDEQNDCECEPESIARSNSMSKDEFLNFLRNHPAAIRRRSVKLTPIPILDNITETGESQQSPVIQNVTTESISKQNSDTTGIKVSQIRDESNNITKSDVERNVSSIPSRKSSNVTTSLKVRRSSMRKSSKSNTTHKTEITTNEANDRDSNQNVKIPPKPSNSELKASTNTSTLGVPKSIMNTVQTSKTPDESDQKSNKSNGSISSFSGTRYQQRRRLSRSQRDRRSSLHKASLGFENEDDEFQQIQHQLSSLGRYSKRKAPSKSEEIEDTITIPKTIWNRSIRNQIYGVPPHYSSCNESTKDNDSDDENDGSIVQFDNKDPTQCTTKTLTSSAKLSHQASDHRSDEKDSSNGGRAPSSFSEDDDTQYWKSDNSSTYVSKEHAVKQNDNTDNDSDDENDGGIVQFDNKDPTQCTTKTLTPSAKLSHQASDHGSDENDSSNDSRASSSFSEDDDTQYWKNDKRSTYVSKERAVKQNDNASTMQLDKRCIASKTSELFQPKSEVRQASLLQRRSSTTVDERDSRANAITKRRELSVSPRPMRLRRSSPRGTHQQSTDTEVYTDDSASGSAIELDSDDEEAQKLRCRSRGYRYDFFMSRQSRTGTEIIEQYKQSRSNRSSKGNSPASSSESSRKSSLTIRQRPRLAFRTLGSLEENDLLKVVQQPTRTRKTGRRNSVVFNKTGSGNAAETGVNANLLKVALERAAQCSARLEDRLRQQLK